MEISANAKINLTLDILRRREDGYHDLQMVMQSVSLADELTVTPARGGVGTAVSDLHFLPTGGKNLAQMAAAAFRAATGLGGEVDVSIRKHVPVCAGLAGGSADAAAVLHAMNRLTGAGLSPVELAKIGERVGSDVPFCVLGGAALAVKDTGCVVDFAVRPKIGRRSGDDVDLVLFGQSGKSLLHLSAVLIGQLLQVLLGEKAHIPGFRQRDDVGGQLCRLTNQLRRMGKVLLGPAKKHVHLDH